MAARDLDIHAAIALNYAHNESMRDEPDIKKIQSLLYEAIHRSGHHPDSWFASFMIYRRIAEYVKLQSFAWQRVLEIASADELHHFEQLAQRYS